MACGEGHGGLKSEIYLCAGSDFGQDSHSLSLLLDKDMKGPMSWRGWKNHGDHTYHQH